MTTEQLKYKLEDHVNDWVKTQFDRLKLKNQKNYHTESDIPDYLKVALKGRAKTENKTNFGKPDFSLTQYQAPLSLKTNSVLKSSSPTQKMGLNLMAHPSIIRPSMAHFITPQA